jgi:hypothetical protein
MNTVPLGHVSMDQHSTGEGATAQRTTEEGCDEIQSVECRVDSVGAHAILNKTDVNGDGPGFQDKDLNSSSVLGGVNFIEREVDKNISSQAYSSNVNSVSPRATVKGSIMSKQGSVTETRLSAGHLDSMVQDTNTSPLGTENLLLRGARLKNTEFVIGKCYSMS